MNGYPACQLLRWAGQAGCALLLATAWSATTWADTAKAFTCDAPEHFVEPSRELPVLREARQADRQITIVVLGAAPSTRLEGAAPEWRYSDRLVHHLSPYWKGARISVTAVDTTGETAEEVAARMPGILARYRPNLLVWEAGKADAAKGVDVTEFGRALEAGIQSVGATETALVLMDPGYEEEFPLWVDPEPYVEMLGQIVRGYPVLLFSRHELTQYWDSLDTRPRRTLHEAQLEQLENQASDCMAMLLAEMIAAASE